MKAWKIWSVILAFLTVAVGLAANEFALSRRAFGDTDESFNDIVSGLLTAVEQLEKFEIYEGLPRSSGAKGLFEQERQSKPNINFDGNWFYLVPQTVSANDRGQLQRLFSAGLFEPWGGTKLCGGFHADYAVAGESAGSVFMAMFCLSCHEARIVKVTPKAPAGTGSVMARVTVDLADKHFPELREILKRYRKLLPVIPPQKATLPPPPAPKVPVQL